MPTEADLPWVPQNCTRVKPIWTDRNCNNVKQKDTIPGMECTKTKQLRLGTPEGLWGFCRNYSPDLGAVLRAEPMAAKRQAAK